MAKWDEKDERWRVQDLGAAGHNVNNWHWVEKNALPWSKERLTALLGGATLAAAGGTVVASTGAVVVEGDAVINQRKGKLIPAYELSITLKWRGTDADGAEGSGEVLLPYVSEENADEDPEVQVTVNAGGAAAEKMRALIVAHGRPVVHKAVAQFLAELSAGGPVGGGGAPAADGGKAGGDAAASAPPAAPPAAAPAPAAPAPKPAPAPSSKGGHMIELTEKFFASAKDIFDCFTDARRMSAYTQSPAEAEPRPGGAFSMFGGTIRGTFLELAPPSRLEMDWRFDSWEEGVASRVVLEVEEKERGSVVVRLKQTGVPDVDRYGHHEVRQRTEAGWREQVFSRIRKVFGYGV